MRNGNYELTKPTRRPSRDNASVAAFAPATAEGGGSPTEPRRLDALHAPWARVARLAGRHLARLVGACDDLNREPLEHQFARGLANGKALAEVGAHGELRDLARGLAVGGAA